MNTQKTNWWLDAILLAGFLATFFLDITGVELHQWIGIGLGILLFVHFFRHMDWIGTVVSRFFEKCTTSARVNLIIDMLLMGGFGMIIFTGLVISTWLNLAFINYTGWWAVHVSTAVFTLIALLVKLYLHRKWIVNVAETRVFGRLKKNEPVGIPVTAVAQVNRREFLKMSAVLGAGVFVAGAQMRNVLERVSESQSTPTIPTTAGQIFLSDQTVNLPLVQKTTETTVAQVATLSPTTVPTIVPTSVPVVSNQNTSACTVRCHRGCSFPGKCRKYSDANGNGKCDLGECL